MPDFRKLGAMYLSLEKPLETRRETLFLVVLASKAVVSRTDFVDFASTTVVWRTDLVDLAPAAATLCPTDLVDVASTTIV